MHAHHNDNPPASWYEPLDVIEDEPPATVVSTVVDRPTLINRPTAVLTPRGVVALMVIHLERELVDLGGEDRAYIVSLLRDLVEEVTA
jgi:hypothetical protein